MAEPLTFAGRYRVVRRISRTEMAEVYVAEDDVLQRTVAVKLLLPELAGDPDFVARFQREARAAAMLNHPNIVSVFDSGEHEGSYFIVMEYIDGVTLAEVIADEAPLAETRAAEIGIEVAAALTAAHDRGIVHRDVKPGNVLLGGSGTVKVADFGIARAMGENSDLTSPGTIVGSVSYLSPEQAQGGDIDLRSDIYSLGAVLYAMVTGRPPFVADAPIAIAHQHVHEPPPPPTDLNPSVSAGFEALVLRTLAKNPADRPPTAEAVRQELLSIVQTGTAPDTAPPAGDEATAMMTAPVTAAAPPVDGTRVIDARPVPPARPSADVIRRRRLTVAALVAVVLVIVAVVLASVASRDTSDAPPTTTTVPTVATTATATKRTVTTARPTTTVTEAPTTTEAPAPEPTAPPTTISDPTDTTA